MQDTSNQQLGDLDWPATRTKRVLLIEEIDIGADAFEGRISPVDPATNIKALQRAGIAFTVNSYDYDPVVDHRLQAADALGEQPEHVLKTLMALVDGARLTARTLGAANLEIEILMASISPTRISSRLQ